MRGIHIIGHISVLGYFIIFSMENSLNFKKIFLLINIFFLYTIKSNLKIIADLYVNVFPFQTNINAFE